MVVNHLIVILTERCNSKCRGCTYWHTGFKEINMDIIILLIYNLTKCGLKYITFTGGEPLLYPYIDRVVEYVSKQNLKIKMVTNGSLLNSVSNKTIDCIDLWTISLDATDKETYRSVRRVDYFGDVIDGIKRLIKRKKRVRLSFLVQKRNFHQIVKFVELATNLNVDSISFLWPDFRGKFGSSFHPYESNDFLMNSEEIDILANIYLPRLKQLFSTNQILSNFKPHDFESILSYLRALASGQNLPNIRKKRCLLPMNTLIVDPYCRISLCFYFSEKISILFGEKNDFQNLFLDIAKMQQKYFFSDSLFKKHCAACLQVPLSAEGSTSVL